MMFLLQFPGFFFRVVLVCRAFEMDARVPFELVFELFGRRIVETRFHITHAVLKALA